MEVVHEVCCGLDGHKKSVTACVLWASGRRRQTREFGTSRKPAAAVRANTRNQKTTARELDVCRTDFQLPQTNTCTLPQNREQWVARKR